MSVYSQSNINSNDFPQKLIGEILREAGLISSPQLKTALKTQIKYSDFRLGEIIVSQGWLQQKTIDFLVDVFSRCTLHKYLSKQPIGYYLQEAGLLTGEQIDTLIQEQKNFLLHLDEKMTRYQSFFFCRITLSSFSVDRVCKTF